MRSVPGTLSHPLQQCVRKKPRARCESKPRGALTRVFMNTLAGNTVVQLCMFQVFDGLFLMAAEETVAYA